MVTGSYSKMMSEKAMQSLSNDDYTEELGKIMRERVAQQEINDRERELSLLRSGSAPPTVDQSFAGVFSGNDDVSEEDMRSDPAYVSYYYQNVNMNPRLPPPLQGSARRLQGHSGNLTGAVIGDRRRVNMNVGGGSGSLFSMHPNEWSGTGLPHMIQGNKGSASSVSRFPASSDSRALESAESSEICAAIHNELASLDALCSDTNMQHISSLTSMSSSESRTYASSVGASISRTATSDPHVLGRVFSPHMPAVGSTRLSSFDRRNLNVPKPYDEALEMADSSALAAALSGLSLSMDTIVDERNQYPTKQNHYFNKNSKGPYTSTSYAGSSLPSQYLNAASPTFANTGLDEYPISPSPYGNQVGSNISTAELQNFARLANRGGGPGNGSPVVDPYMDPSYLEYLASNGYLTAAPSDLITSRESLPNRHRDFLALQKAYFEALLQKSHYRLSSGKSFDLSNCGYGNSGFGLGFPYTGNPMAPSIFPDSPMHYPSSLRNMAGGCLRTWPSEPICNLDGSFASLLDEFKGNKTRCIELAEIADHVVEFSTDQYGSRFIQQKLETASTMEKNMVFREIMPQALSLMTDVFGNYVIQKFFEHGSSSQIRQLAEHLIGHVLTLSLQMYGCRVIQKAIEVTELDQQTRMVAELDGHIMRCVRDQNGNHVIQKCIECVPEAAIQFIVTTFYEQVVALSTHPYGCRVIQRVLEHCHSPTTQSIVMNEIMKSVCMLAQDQYGNYVIQHVLEHGKPHERSAIIKQLIGKVVQMSQQKFASNVIEKCLSFGTPEERQTLVDEMLGNTDENEPLQVLMKDQFANYVVQKVLESCDDQQLEMILNRIKVHLNALKKYTYGKHIVARVEKLVAAGERRISILSSYNSAQM